MLVSMTPLVLDVALSYGMKSRHHILEELDIKCGQLSPSHSQLRFALMKNAPNMVKGAHLHVLPIVSMVFVTVLASCLGAQIKKFVYNNNGFGSYSFEYETSDGSYRREDGGLVPGPDGSSLVVRGEYGYIDPDGKPFSMKYVADRNGYQPRILYGLVRRCHSVVYTYEDIELRRIFPSEFPQDTIRKSGSMDPEHLGRYGELKSYFKYPKAKVNSHFEELVCYDRDDRKLCRIDLERYSPEEDSYYISPSFESHVDRRRVYCFMLLCFTEDELDRVVASF